MSLHLLLDDEAVILTLFLSCSFHFFVDILELVFDLLDLGKVHLEHDGVLHHADGSQVSSLGE